MHQFSKFSQYKNNVWYEVVSPLFYSLVTKAHIAETTQAQVL